MISAIECFKDNRILYHDNVLQIRKCIQAKYPQYTLAQTSKLFALAIHKILDQHLAEFNATTRQCLKDKLLKEAIAHASFDINVYDVILSYTNLSQDLHDGLDELVNWVNRQQSSSISSSELLDLIISPVSSYADIAPASLKSVTLPELPMADMKVSTNVDHVTPMLLRKLNRKPVPLKLYSTIGGFILLLLLGMALRQSRLPVSMPAYLVAQNMASTSTLVSLETSLTPNHLQSHLQYKKINHQALKDWLIHRGSLLADEPYFTSLISIAKEFNINPLLMFAITGQEQGFVPKEHPKALEIVNNPFNVYGSWQAFNTTFEDTSRIAARTILNLSEGCPENEDPIKWLNKQYAEDPNWHKGVSSLLTTLEEVASLN